MSALLSTGKETEMEIAAEQYLNENGQERWRITDTSGNILEEDIHPENLDSKWNEWETWATDNSFE